MDVVGMFVRRIVVHSVIGVLDVCTGGLSAGLHGAAEGLMNVADAAAGITAVVDVITTVADACAQASDYLGNVDVLGIAQNIGDSAGQFVQDHEGDAISLVFDSLKEIKL